ncbi:MAG: phosphopantetheine-binding protein [Kangiellaceae bacterium]|jgi:acyl carrier protein|nr:phosphopantetheine-binding protein [Kangiellaceae bacterium]
MTKEQLLSSTKQMLIETLSLDMTSDQLDDDALLLGAIPEFDSMAIVSVITSIEETYNVQVEDDEMSAEVFETVESLTDFIAEKVA